MKLLLPRESFVRVFAFNKAVSKKGFDTPQKQSDIRGEFWDYMDGVVEVPPAKDLAEKFGLAEHTIRKWTELLGYPYKRGARAVDDRYKTIVAFLEKRRDPLNLTQLCALCFPEIAALKDTHRKALAQVKAKRPDLYSLIVKGRKRKFINRPQQEKTPTDVIQERILRAYKNNPEKSLLDVARDLDITLNRVTEHARRLVTKGELPEKVLTNGPRRVVVAYRQYVRDWETSPEDLRDLNITDASYMYGVTIDDMRSIEIKSGLTLPYDKKAIAVIKSGGLRQYRDNSHLTTTAIERVAWALSDALDRKVSIKELAAVLRIQPEFLERLLEQRSTRLAKYVDKSLAFDATALTYRGDYIEGAGNFDAPAEWIDEIKGGGYMGVDLTGGFWRRYYQLFKHRQRGEMFKNGVFVEMGVAPR